MAFLNRSFRIAALLLLLFAGPNLAGPSFAGPDDVARLQKYAGNWKGAGTLVGPDPGKVVCRLTFKPSGSKLSYTGRCTFDGASNGFGGTLSYNATKKQYEARSSAGTIIGETRSGSIIFTLEQSSTGRGTVSSKMTFGSGVIRIDFKVTDAKSGDSTSARITFSKS